MERLPVLWQLDRYHIIRDILYPSNSGSGALYREWLGYLLEAGYGVAIVDARGAGASFGSAQGPFAAAEIRDAYDITEWLAGHPWSTGRIGMIGRSYSGIVQYLAAASRPPHLCAAFAEMALGDLYGFVYSGGIFRHDFALNWQKRVRDLDCLADAIAVDEDGDRSCVQAAQAEHRRNRDVYDMFFSLPYRDSVDSSDGSSPYQERSPLAYRDSISASAIPICHYSGWMDLWVRDAILWFPRLHNAQALTIGPWSHGGGINANLAAAQDEWFGPWLKEARPSSLTGTIRYLPLSGHAGETWRTLQDWPPSDTCYRKLHLRTGPSGTVASCNDGCLDLERESNWGADRLAVNYESTTGRASRWSTGYGAEFRYPDLTRHAQTCLTYTSDPCRDNADIVGHPQVHLWISTVAPDVDIFVYLEQVYPDGTSEYLTEGCLRLSHRAVTDSPLEALSLPFHPSTAASLSANTESPVELWFDLHPVALRIVKGRRLRLCIAGADRDNALTPRLSHSAMFQLHRGNIHPSSVTLPFRGQAWI